MFYSREIIKNGSQSVGDRLSEELYNIQNFLQHKVLSVHESQREICGTTYQSFIIVCDNGEPREEIRGNE